MKLRLSGVVTSTWATIVDVEEPEAGDDYEEELAEAIEEAVDDAISELEFDIPGTLLDFQLEDKELL